MHTQTNIPTHTHDTGRHHTGTHTHRDRHVCSETHTHMQTETRHTDNTHTHKHIRHTHAHKHKQQTHTHTQIHTHTCVEVVVVVATLASECQLRSDIKSDARLMLLSLRQIIQTNTSWLFLVFLLSMTVSCISVVAEHGSQQPFDASCRVVTEPAKCLAKRFRWPTPILIP